MRLQALLQEIDYKILRGTPDIEISAVVYDSRKLPLHLHRRYQI